jgi:bifunctional lysine-specific demethylase and histidyl-hydroxylase NO66
MATPTAPTPDLTRAPSALGRCVGDADRFLADQFTFAPHRWAGAAFDDLLSLADVDAQLSGAGLRRPAVRLVRDGQILDPATWTRRARTGATWVEDLLHPGKALGLFADGATIVLQSLHRWWPPLTRFCRELEGELGHAVQANAYLTPPGAAGLTPHHDTHDVFVLQVHGTKHWTVRAPIVEAPLARHRSDHEVAAQQPVLFEADMAPGDCLYLPRGFIHSAAAQDGVSLHVTIGVLATTVHDLLRRIVERAAEEPVFRRTLPPGHAADATSAGTSVKAAVAELVSWLGELDLDQLADELVDSATHRRAPLLDGQLLELAGLGALTDATVVERRPGVVPRIRNDGARLVLRLGDRRLDLPSSVEPAVVRLLDGEPHAVAGLSDLLDEPSRAVLVRRLIREGALRTTDGP